MTPFWVVASIYTQPTRFFLWQRCLFSIVNISSSIWNLSHSSGNFFTMQTNQNKIRLCHSTAVKRCSASFSSLVNDLFILCKQSQLSLSQNALNISVTVSSVNIERCIGKLSWLQICYQDQWTPIELCRQPFTH